MAVHLTDKNSAAADGHELDGALAEEREVYLHELATALEEIEILILRIHDAAEGEESKGRLLRQIHSIKGIAGSYGLERVAQAAHDMEDLLDDRRFAANLNGDRIDRLLAQNDRLKALAQAYLHEDAEADRSRASDSAASAIFSGAVKRRIDRVLVVESSAATLQLCTQVMTAIGATRVQSASDGYEALGWLLNEAFDVVITSLQVAWIDGQSLAAVLRTIPSPNSATPVILLTSAATALDPSKARPDFVVEKNRDLSSELRGILSRLTGERWPARQQSVQLSPGDPKKILVIDDSPEIHDLVKLSFKPFPDVQIVALLDPSDAVDRACREMPDLILLDVQMQPLSGKEILKDLKAKPQLSQVPVAFFTASDAPDEQRQLAGLGAWQIFKKPFAPKTFANQVLRLYRER